MWLPVDSELFTSDPGKPADERDKQPEGTLVLLKNTAQTQR